jgi:hypothetical protein
MHVLTVVTGRWIAKEIEFKRIAIEFEFKNISEMIKKKNNVLVLSKMSSDDSPFEESFKDLFIKISMKVKVVFV